jgi:co-chaperonin GroES (HSP10)
MSELKLSPWGDRLYIVLDEPKESVGTIILPERHSERSRVATVSAIGEDVKHIKVGDKVLISYYTGVFIHLPDFAFRGKEDLHRIVREDEILARVEV